MPGYGVLDTLISYAGVVAAIFAVLNFKKMHEPALKTYVRTDRHQLCDGLPIAVIIASENTTNNPFRELSLTALVQKPGLTGKDIQEIRSFNTTMQLGPQGTMYHTIDFFEELKKMGIIDRATNQTVDKSLEFPILIYVKHSYKQFLFKKSIENYHVWSYKNGWWSQATTSLKLVTPKT